MNIRTPPFPTFVPRRYGPVGRAAGDSAPPAQAASARGASDSAKPAQAARPRGPSDSGPRKGETFARALQTLLRGSPDPTDQQLLAAIARWRAGELA